MNRIRNLIAKHEARYAAAVEAMDVNCYGQRVKPSMTHAEAMDEMGKAGRRLYQLRRELARAEAV